MESCIFCVEKHMGKAHVYHGEAQSGYEGRFTMMLGELAAAEEEAREEYPQLADLIRKARKVFEASRLEAKIHWPSMLSIVERYAREGDPNTRKVSPLDVQASDSSKIGAKTPCSGCKDKLKDFALSIEKKQQALQAPKDAPLLIIMTAIAGWDSSYSLTSVILDQARAAAHAGFRVQVTGMANMSRSGLPSVDGVEWIGLIPFCHWSDDRIDDQQVDAIEEAVRHHLLAVGPCAVLTHDWMLISSYVDLAKAVHRIGTSIPGVSWFHQIHSSLGARPTAPDAIWRSTLPEDHHLCLVNYADVASASDYYQIGRDRILTIPNSRDIRSMLGVTERVNKILEQFPLHLAEVAQIYPLSTPRAQAKGLLKTIKLFSRLKQYANVRLLVVNAHANGPEPERVKAEIDAAIESLGMSNEVAWTSDLDPASKVNGLTQQEVFSLFQTTNLFCFPSTSEAAGLVMLEAALAGCLLVLNLSLPVMSEYCGHLNALWTRFGSLTDAIPEGEIYYPVMEILESLGSSLANQSKRRVLAKYGLNALSERMADAFWP